MNGDSDSTDGAPLEALKATHREAARVHLLAGELEQASARLREAELVDRLVRLSPRPRRAPIFAIGLTATCGLLVFTAWKVKVSTFIELNVSIRGETTAAQLTLAGPTVFDPLRGTAVELGQLNALSSQIMELPENRNGNRSVRVHGGAPVEVTGLSAPGGAKVALFAVSATGKPPTLALRAYGAGILGEVRVRPGTLLSTETGDGHTAPDIKLDGDVLDVVSFGCGDCTDTPLRLDVPAADSFTWGSVPVSQLGFAAEHVQADGTTYFTSGLQEGSVRLLDVDRSEAIENGDGLKLDLARPRRFQLGRSTARNTFSFVYDGTVRRLSLGPVGAERDLSPSLLEYLYRQKAMALFWGGAAFLWGLFTGVRRLWQSKAE